MELDTYFDKNSISEQRFSKTSNIKKDTLVDIQKKLKLKNMLIAKFK
jgi:hypothetical protein